MEVSDHYTTCILLADILFTGIFVLFSLQSIVRKTIKSIDFNVSVAVPVMGNVVIYANTG